jgi:SAM-dependent methyltransferase
MSGGGDRTRDEIADSERVAQRDAQNSSRPGRRTIAAVIGTVGRRAVDRVERRIFPEAHSAGEQWQRVVMNGVVDRYLATLGIEDLNAAEISGNAQQAKRWKSFTALNYPAFDVCAPLPADAATYDVVICEQVLEHVVDPWAAVKNLRKLCSPGGHVVVTSPFLIKVHEEPAWNLKDYWRFTPRGLKTLLESAGLEVTTVGHWGNRQCVYGNLARWSAYRRWQSLGNRRDTPVQIWAFARNPGAVHQ